MSSPIHRISSGGDLCDVGGVAITSAGRVAFRGAFMFNRSQLGTGVMIAGLLATPIAQAPAPAPWRDPSSHRSQFIAVDTQIQLEVLDWGGPGRPVVLLAGNGATAHSFDDFAPKLARDYRVYGITRRGFGASTIATSGYEADRLADDVIAVLDALNLVKPVLVGHSLGGQELSSVAARHPERIAGLVYLDAGYHYAFDSAASRAFEAGMQQRLSSIPPPPRPAPKDLESFSALQAFSAGTLGIALPESEFRQCCEPNDKPGGKRRTPPSVAAAIQAGTRKYPAVQVPALAIFAQPHDLGSWVENNPAAESLLAWERSATEAVIKAWETDVPSARVVRIPRGHHFVFLSHEADVLREMRALISRLP